MKRKAPNTTSAATIVKNQRDRFYLNSLQQNTHAQQQYGIMGLQQQNRRPRDLTYEDFLTMYLVRWSLTELIKATALLLDIMRLDNPQSLESDFSDTAGISSVTESGETKIYSFRRYYEMVYSWAIERQADLLETENEIKEEEEQEVEVTIGVNEKPVLSKLHVINLLRACFVIGFVYDIRIRRFVMAQHSIHTLYTRTSPPTPERATAFMMEATPYVDDFLGGDRVSPSIIDMVNEVIRRWLEIRHTTHVPSIKAIDVNT